MTKYEGVYYSAELNTVYKIESKNNQLNALHARNLPILLEPFQPELFASSTPFFQEVKFIKNEHNGVQGMLVSGSKNLDVEFEKVCELP